MSQYTRMMEIAGIRRPGQKVKVVGGRHFGLVTEIKDINWSEGEVLLTTAQDYDRWFAVGMICNLDPDYGPMPDLVADRLDKARASRITSPAAPAVRPPEVPKIVTPRPIPEPAPAPVSERPSWLPKPKSQ